MANYFKSELHFFNWMNKSLRKINFDFDSVNNDIISKALVKIYKRGYSDLFSWQVNNGNLYYVNDINIKSFIKDAKKENIQNNVNENNTYATYNEIAASTNLSDEFKRRLLKLKDIYGVYIYSTSKYVIYVGKSINLGSRAFESFKERAPTFIKNKEQIYFKYIKTDTKIDSEILELYMINLLKPLLNVRQKYIEQTSKIKITHPYKTSKLIKCLK